MVIGLLFTPIMLNLSGLIVFSVLTAFGMAAYETSKYNINYNEK